RDKPSMVVKLRSFASCAGIWQERTAFPFSRTVHEPHTPTPQPNFVPVRPNESRKIQTSGMSSSTSTSLCAPLMVSEIFISLRAQGDNRINARRASRRQPAGKCNCQAEDRSRNQPRDHVRHGHVRPLTLHKADKAPGDNRAERETD